MKTAGSARRDYQIPSWRVHPHLCGWNKTPLLKKFYFLS